MLPGEPAEPPEQSIPELPAIESLGADSDYTVFLARGVPRVLQAQALRVAWASDPAIANFRGMAEYAWDFNAPGYGALTPGDDARAWVSQIIRSGVTMLPAADAEASAAAEAGKAGVVSTVEPLSVPAIRPPPVEALGRDVAPLSNMGFRNDAVAGDEADHSRAGIPAAQRFDPYSHAVRRPDEGGVGREDSRGATREHARGVRGATGRDVEETIVRSPDHGSRSPAKAAMPFRRRHGGAVPV
jgi:hypothetical protein